MIQIDMKKSAETTLDGEYSTVMADLTAAIRDIRKKYPEEASDEDFEKIVESNADLKELLQNYNKTWNLMEQNISTMEKMIIDKILLPRLSKVHEDEKRSLISEYGKFLMLSKEYLQEKTEIKIIDDNSNNERDGFIQGLQVAPSLSNDKSKTKKTLNENIQSKEDTEIHIAPEKDDENCL